MGTTEPSFPLTVDHNGFGIVQSSGINKKSQVGIYTDTTNRYGGLFTVNKINLMLGTGNLAPQFVLDTFGNAGIGVSSLAPAQKLEVAGGIKIGGTNVAAKGSLRYVAADSSIEAYDNTKWKSLINVADVVGNYVSGEAPYFSSSVRGSRVNIPALTYTIKKSGTYLVILTSDGSGNQEKNDIYNPNDNRNDFEGEVRVSDGPVSGSTYVKKRFFTSYPDAISDVTQDVSIRYVPDEGDKSFIRTFNAGDVVYVNAIVYQSAGPSAPAQQNPWYIYTQVKYILLN